MPPEQMILDFASEALLFACVWRVNDSYKIRFLAEPRYESTVSLLMSLFACCFCLHFKLF